ncbi:MAG: zinc ABC transporter substrate-binding protein [Nitrospirae bacterium]|nr:zinc ABC transporter substrate-binding protein [Nitrospirota bacterium]
MILHRKKTALRLLVLASLLLEIEPGMPSARALESAGSNPPIKVVATFPVLKDLVQQVGRDRVAVTSLLNGLESEHTYTPKPTDIISIQEAQMLVQIGLGLEVWVQALIKNADNRRLLIVTTSTGVALLKNQENHNDSHSLGDPHIWLDPENVKRMLRHITEGLLKIDPAHQDYYLRNQTEYIKDLDATQQRLLIKLRPLRNKQIVTHHAAWSYFARRFGFTIRGSITPQVGTEPSAKHLFDLIRMIKTEKIRVIVSEPQLNPKLPQMLAQETGAAVVVLTPIPGAVPGAETYRSMIEYDVDQLVNALQD